MWQRACSFVFIATILFTAGQVSSLAEDVPPKPLKPQLMSAVNESDLRALLPQVDDAELERRLNDPRTLFYTEREMPRCYQDWDAALQGVHAADYNISANDSEPYGNGNLEFPWGAPGGTHRAKHISTFRFIWLPLDEQGHTRPIVWYRNRFSFDRVLGYGWTFPVGTMVGEVLLIDRPDGDRLAFEIRVRTRVEGQWDVDVLRPFPRAEDLAQRITELRPDWYFQPNLQQLLDHLIHPCEMPVATLESGHSQRKVFQQVMAIDSLPPIDDAALVVELLQHTTFRSALAEDWRSENGKRTVAPTTEAEFHVVPANYDAGFIDVDSQSCMRCHDTVNRHVREFQPGRDWYGRVRGCDGIFSFHPFALDAISDNGYSRPVELRQELIDAGWLAAFDPEQHPREIYRRIPGLDE
jgi:hypothetical protein